MKIRRIALIVVIGVTVTVYKLKAEEQKLKSSSEEPAGKPIRSNDAAYQVQDTSFRKISPSYPEDMTSKLTFDPRIPDGPEKDTTLKSLMDRRMSYLREQCQTTGANKVKAATKWKKRIVLKAPGFFKVCATPKGGSTSWRTLTWQMPKGVVGRIPPLNILNVRNPLARLASAYRDKFLGGLPLSKYDDAWRKKTNSRMPWYNLWETFWYGALVCRGSIPTKSIKKRAIGAVNWANIDHGGSIYKFLRKFSLNSATKYRNVFHNASFSFEDFLRYVVWTHDIGYMNKHWAPVVFSCSPCNFRYDFIVHLETISPEFNYITKFLNHTEGIQIEEKHKTKTVKSSDIHLYENIPYDLMKRILDIYKYDFELFGYMYPFE